METRAFQIELKDGRVFRIFCENRSQIERFYKSAEKIKPQIETVKELTTGLHTVKQWEQITETL